MSDISLINTTILFIFILLSAFFSSSETAFTAVNQIKLRNIVKNKPKKAKRLEKIYQNPQRLLTTILIGNNISNVAVSAFATTILLALLKEVYGIQNIVAAMSIITALVTTILLIFGEITPKTLALKQPEKLALSFANPIRLFLVLFYPLIFIFELFSKLFSSIFSIDLNTSKQLITMEELKTMVDVSREEGVLEKEKEEMLQGIFEFSETVVREIMTPRTDAICINVSETVQNVIQLISEKGHSRIPVYDNKIDNTLGIIYAKDLLNVSKDDLQGSVRKFMRKAVFIPESKNIEDLLKQMKSSRFHMAIVVDEYGGMAGIVTLEDIIEEIIGEIQDEYDSDERPLITQSPNGHYLVSAAMSIKELGDEIEFEFPESDDYDTLGGFVLSLIGEFPEKGVIVTHENLQIKVKEIRKRRIITLDIEKKEIPSEDST